MAKQVERIARLQEDLNTARFLVKNNPHMSKKELNAAKFGFCYAKASSDILYQLACMSGRHDNIVEELENLVTRLNKDEDGDS
tara:strand:- start:48876 stop:49124 length:249 start_codon:yes stop_codon:yes gene_type:complete